MEVGFQRWRAGNSTIPQQFSQSHSKFLFPQQIPPANFLKLPANSHAIFPAISLANFRSKFPCQIPLALYCLIRNYNIALFENQLYPKVAGLKSRYCLIRNYDIALFENQLYPKVAVLKSRYCLIRNYDIALFENHLYPKVEVLKASHCLFWNRHIALFELVILPYLKKQYCLIWMH